MSSEDKGGRSAAWGVAAAVSAAIFVGVLTLTATLGSSKFPIWPTYVSGVATLLSLYMCFANIWEWWPCAPAVRESMNGGAPPSAAKEGPRSVIAVGIPGTHPSSAETFGGQVVRPSPAPVSIRLRPELDTATNHLRLGVLNRGAFGRFRVEVVEARDQDGNWVGSRSWPVPWLEDGSVGAKEVPMFGRPLLDLAHFDFLGLQEDLEGTKWLKGNHFTFPSLPQAVTFRYSAVKKWSELTKQYIVLTLRVIRDEPEGYIDFQFKIGTDGTEPYCRELTVEPVRQSGGESVATPEPEAALTDRWCHTSDGVKVPALSILQRKVMDHPGYRGQSQDRGPSVRIGVLVGCQQIDTTFSGSVLRAKFVSFLNSPVMRELIGSLTHVALEATWTSLAGHGVQSLEAALTVGSNAMEGVPVASALFLPPTGEPLYGRPERAAALVLYIEPRTAEGEVPPAAGLAAWHRNVTLTLAVPGAFADFLSKSLGLRTLRDPRAQFGIWLESHQQLTAMVDTENLRTLPGSFVSNHFTGWAYADPDGKSASQVARDLLVQMSEYSLHLDDFESALPEVST